MKIKQPKYLNKQNRIKYIKAITYKILSNKSKAGNYK